jgi:hypothetical protein
MSPIANPEPVEVISRASECMRRLMEAGLTYDALQIPISHPGTRQRLVSYWLAGAPEIPVVSPSATIVCQLTPSYIRAREIMGRNMFGIEEATRYFGVNPSTEELTVLLDIPFSEAVLMECKETHILVAMFPLSINDIRGMAPELFREDRYDKPQPFSSKHGSVRWLLVKKTPSTGGDKIPFAYMVVYAAIGHFLATGEWFLGSAYLRCTDFDSGSYHVIVGVSDSGKLDVLGDWGSIYKDRVGTASRAWNPSEFLP